MRIFFNIASKTADCDKNAAFQKLGVITLCARYFCHFWLCKESWRYL